MHTFLATMDRLKYNMKDFMEKYQFTFTVDTSQIASFLIRKNTKGFDRVTFHSRMNGFKYQSVTKRIDEVEKYLKPIVEKHQLAYSDDQTTVRLVHKSKQKIIHEIKSEDELQIATQKVLFFLGNIAFPFFETYNDLSEVLKIIKNSEIKDMLSFLNRKHAIFRALIIARLFGDAYYDINKSKFKKIYEENASDLSHLDYVKKELDAYNDLIIELDNLKPKYTLS